MASHAFPFVTTGFLTAVLVGFSFGFAAGANEAVVGLVAAALVVGLGYRLVVCESRLFTMESHYGRLKPPRDRVGFDVRPWLVEKWLRWYAETGSITRWMRIFRANEGWFVAGRAAFLGVAGFLAYPHPGLWFLEELPLLFIWVLGGLLLIDALLITTAHAFVCPEPVRSVFRFVVLNLSVFGTLPLWFVLLAAPFPESFNPRLTYVPALQWAFAGTTTVQVATPIIAATPLGYLLSYLAISVSLYFLVVVLVAAVNRVQDLYKGLQGRYESGQGGGSES